MIIKVDKKGKQAVVDLCDVALRVGGLKNLTAVQTVLEAIQDVQVPKKKKGSKDA
jgi:hypothetical protein